MSAKVLSFPGPLDYGAAVTALVDAHDYLAAQYEAVTPPTKASFANWDARSILLGKYSEVLDLKALLDIQGAL